MAHSKGIDRALIVCENLDQLSAVGSKKAPLTETHGPHVSFNPVKIWALFHWPTVHLCLLYYESLTKLIEEDQLPRNSLLDQDSSHDSTMAGFPQR